MILATISAHLKRLLKRAARRMVAPALYICLIVYFSFFALYGDRGLVAMRQLKQEVVQAQEQLAQVRKERERIQTRSALLRPDNLDRDMLDERARVMLNYSHPDDVIVVTTRRGEAATRSPSAPPASR